MEIEPNKPKRNEKFMGLKWVFRSRTLGLKSKNHAHLSPSAPSTQHHSVNGTWEVMWWAGGRSVDG